MNFYYYHKEPFSLRGHEEMEDLLPHLIWDNIYFDVKEVNATMRRNLAKNANYATKYASRILKSAFPEAEKVISKSALFSFIYANLALKTPFPLGEPTIARSDYWSYEYATLVLKSRFILAEPTIKERGNFWERYKKKFGIDE